MRKKRTFLIILPLIIGFLSFNAYLSAQESTKTKKEEKLEEYIQKKKEAEARFSQARKEIRKIKMERYGNTDNEKKPHHELREEYKRNKEEEKKLAEEYRNNESEDVYRDYKNARKRTSLTYRKMLKTVMEEVHREEKLRKEKLLPHRKAEIKALKEVIEYSSKISRYSSGEERALLSADINRRKKELDKRLRCINAMFLTRVSGTIDTFEIMAESNRQNNLNGSIGVLFDDMTDNIWLSVAYKYRFNIFSVMNIIPGILLICPDMSDDEASNEGTRDPWLYLQVDLDFLVTGHLWPRINIKYGTDRELSITMGIIYKFEIPILDIIND